MKKLLSIFLVLFPLMVWGQDYESKGDSAYKAGDYEEAEVQYNAALALLKAQKVDEQRRPIRQKRRSGKPRRLIRQFS